LAFALAPEGIVTDPAGTPWHISDLLETMALASLFTMLFVAVLGFCRVANAHRSD